MRCRDYSGRKSRRNADCPTSLQVPNLQGEEGRRATHIPVSPHPVNRYPVAHDSSPSSHSNNLRQLVRRRLTSSCATPSSRTLPPSPPPSLAAAANSHPTSLPLSDSLGATESLATFAQQAQARGGAARQDKTRSKSVDFLREQHLQARGGAAAAEEGAEEADEQLIDSRIS
jgi:hypothetical protein